jgi:hypothetical protein
MDLRALSERIESDSLASNATAVASNKSGKVVQLIAFNSTQFTYIVSLHPKVIEFNLFF